MGKKTLIITIVAAVLVLGGGVFAYIKFFGGLGPKHGALSVTTQYGQASVFVDDALVGTTPYYSETIKPGKRTVELRGDRSEYTVSLDLERGTQAVLKRDLGVDSVFSSGQNIWLERVKKGNETLAVLSDPEGALVRIDGVEVGVTPLTRDYSDKVTEGEIEFDLEIDLPGYETQRVGIKLPPGYRVNVTADLFLVPMSAEPQPLSGEFGESAVYDIPPPKDLSRLAGAEGWVRSLDYWFDSRGLGDLPQKFDYYIDNDGAIYDPTGAKLTGEGEFAEASYQVGYLNRGGEEGLTEAATTAVGTIIAGAKVTGTAGAAMVEILPTGLGYLNVRSSPEVLSGDQDNKITTVNVGEQFEKVEENSDWVKIKLSDGSLGWVSSQYVKDVVEAAETTTD